MRDHLLETLPPTRYRRFLVYVVGPYKGHRVENEEVFAFLEEVRDGLRTEGFNAFLATDVDVPLEEIDAGARSLASSRASNVVVFVVRRDGKNLGIGIEVGTVLEELGERAPERALFVHEESVRSAMIASVSDRWDATVRTFEGPSDLVDVVWLFARDVMRKETEGELPFPPAEP